jgi:hypothetical protein
MTVGDPKGTLALHVVFVVPQIIMNPMTTKKEKEEKCPRH